jgi:hypothetical protein
MLASIIAMAVITLDCAPRPPADPRTLGGHVYRRDTDIEDHVVYIDEDGRPEPYVVLDDGTKGTCLLLRRWLCDTPMPFNDNAPQAAYYPGSRVDDYLEGTFAKTIDPRVAALIRATDILVTTRDSLYTGRAAVETVDRRIFLLSYANVMGLSGTPMVATEGPRLDCFDAQDRRVAHHESGETGTWWLRTAQTWYDTLVFTVDDQGVVGSAGIGGPNGEYANGVRPAFRLDATTTVTKRNGRYVIDPSQP